MHAPADLREIAIFWGQLRRARMHESNTRTRISELRGEEIATSGGTNAKTKMRAAKLRRGNERLNANLVF